MGITFYYMEELEQERHNRFEGIWRRREIK
jgi:hypothetical protein